MSLSVGEEIITEETIKDCIARDADAPIFGRLGLSYGKAVRFKKEFEVFPPDSSVRGGRRSTLSPINVKPSMGDMAFFTPEQRALYLAKLVYGPSIEFLWHLVFEVVQ